MRKRDLFAVLFLAALILADIGCAGLKRVKRLFIEEEKSGLLLTFAGDIMAHEVNFKMKDYNAIYEDLKDFLKSDDLTFANMETPVCNTLPMSTYPSFNVHSSYLEAAFKGGFDVLSFANNHTNDQGITGIEGTLNAASNLKNKAEAEEKKFFYSGLYRKDETEMRPEIIKVKNKTVLFLAVSEISNSYDSSIKHFYYSPPSGKGRAALLEKIKAFKKNTPCDLFILSIHVNEKEYIRSAEKAKKEWFKKLAESGADIVWAHHPHVMQDWEETELDCGKKAFFMYSMGNFVSGQRMKINTGNPSHFREYTGDSVLLRVEIPETGNLTFCVKPLPVTCYKSPKGFVMKPLTEEWIQTLSGSEKKYFKKRLELMQDYLPITHRK